MLRRFLNRFTDNFGQKFEPAVLILNTATPPIFRDMTTLANFRNLIALSAVTHGRALDLRHPRGRRVLFGEAFSIYPWMLGRHYEDVIGSTPAILGTPEVALLSNFGPAVMANFGPPPSIDLGSPRHDRGAKYGLESQSGIIRAASSGA
ncbi:hypothetical protein [Acidiphilium acidophilum]|uniref:hypothetical protein n=1 Tax=Acidiphilium acidophilum TaxID=76588 RepID=UPI002E8E7384|nr:hypothetical protein [Acidiphilium acidophilum]